eukprot:14272361-Ditylum_brightwellii.AAC.1
MYYHAEPYDDDKMYIDDKAYGNARVNYVNKVYIDNFWYDNSYQLYDDDEAHGLLVDDNETYRDDDSVSKELTKAKLLLQKSSLPVKIDEEIDYTNRRQQW